MKKISFLFFLTMFLIGTDTFLISPLLPVLTKTYNIPADISGWMISAYALGYAASALFVGPLSDGLDRKKVMAVGLIVFALATFFCGFAANFPAMILFRLIAGIGTTFVGSQVWAAIPQLVSKEKIIRAMGYATAGLSISQVVGLPLGSYLAAFSWRAPFFVTAAGSFLLLVMIVALLPSIPAHASADRRTSMMTIYIKLLHTPRAISYLFAYLLFQTGNFAAFSFIGSWYAESFSLRIAGIGTAMMALGIGNAIGSLLGNRLVQRLGEAQSLLFSFCAYFICYTLLPFSPNLWIAEIIFFLIFTVGGFIFPVFMSILQSLTATARGTVSALANAAMYIGTMIGSIIGGLLLSRFPGFTGIAFFTVLAYAVSLSVYARSGLFKAKHTKD